MRIERVDPSAFVGPASRIVQEAWQPPAVHYSAEYLHWRLTFPETAPVAVAAFDGDEPVGFVVAIRPRLRIDGKPLRVLYLGFGAVRPAWRRLGTAKAIYGALVEDIVASGLPAFAFTQPDSSSERLALSVFGVEPLRERTFGEYRTYAFLPPGPTGPGPFTCSVCPEGVAFLDVVRRCRDSRTLWYDPDEATLSHYQHDPRSSVRVLIHGPGGHAVGAALLARSEAVGAGGIVFTAAIESVFLPEPSAEALVALFRFAAGRYAGRVSSPVVLAPNLWGIDRGLLRRAGARATPSAWRGHLFIPCREDPFAAVEGTNAEIPG
jgi:hypothetical protein